ncbi:DUF4148 domain-containing protein [Caldimonas sp. KR1-144]|uniref:DUF4148 domain-containing protein n=1 Tax=Caldimonas sp. KR1-144 TaxID=3400911 RepID=UPI003BFFC59E
MKLHPLIVLAALASSLAPAFAEEQIFDSSQWRSTKSRAEVIADLEIYRASGLAELESRDSVDFPGDRYAQARQRYLALRHSPSFDSRVVEIARMRGEAPQNLAGTSRP